MPELHFVSGLLVWELCDSRVCSPEILMELDVKRRCHQTRPLCSLESSQSLAQRPTKALLLKIGGRSVSLCAQIAAVLGIAFP